jgi:hypothetical protein
VTAATKRPTPDPRAIDRSRVVQGENPCALASARRTVPSTDRFRNQETERAAVFSVVGFVHPVVVTGPVAFAVVPVVAAVAAVVPVVAAP